MLSHTAVWKLGWVLVHSLWQLGAVAAAFAILLGVLRKASASARYLVSCATLVLMVALPVGTLCRMQAPGAAVPPMMETDMSQPAVPSPAVFVPSTAPAVEVAETAAAPVVDAGKADAFWFGLATDGLEMSLPYLVVAWLLGVFGLSLWHLGGWAQLQRLKRRMVEPVTNELRERADALAERLRIRRAVTVVRSAMVQVPTVVGWLKPMVLLPAGALAGLSAEQLEALLAHELAHVKRYDYLVNMLQTAIEILGFYHPAVWWVSRRIRIERENCCDDIAAGVTGDRVLYADALATMEELRGQPRLALAASGGSLLARIRRLCPRAAESDSRAAWLPSLLALGMLVFAAFAGRGMLTDAMAEENVVADEGVADVSAARSPEKVYVFEAATVDALEGTLDVRGVPPGSEPAPSPAVMAAGGANVLIGIDGNKLLASGEAQVTRFPVVGLTAGQDKEIDGRRTLRFAAGGDGETTAESEEVKVGSVIRVRLEDMEDDTATLALDMGKTTLVRWMVITNDATSQPVRVPVLSRSRVQTTMRVPLGVWAACGGATGEATDGGEKRSSFWLFRAVERAGSDGWRDAKAGDKTRGAESRTTGGRAKPETVEPDTLIEDLKLDAGWNVGDLLTRVAKQAGLELRMADGGLLDAWTGKPLECGAAMRFEQANARDVLAWILHAARLSATVSDGVIRVRLSDGPGQVPEDLVIRPKAVGGGDFLPAESRSRTVSLKSETEWHPPQLFEFLCHFARVPRFVIAADVRGGQSRNVTIQFTKTPFPEAFDEALAAAGCELLVDRDTVFVRRFPVYGPLRVSGRVTDAETGAPIPGFRVILGAGKRGARHAVWDRDRSVAGSGGHCEIRFDEGERDDAERLPLASGVRETAGIGEVGATPGVAEFQGRESRRA